MKKYILFGIMLAGVTQASEECIKGFIESEKLPVYRENVLHSLIHRTIVTGDGYEFIVARPVLMQSDFFRVYLESPIGKDHRTQMGITVNEFSNVVEPMLKIMEEQYRLSLILRDNQQLVAELGQYIEQIPDIEYIALKLLWLANKWQTKATGTAVAAYIIEHIDDASLQEIYKLPLDMQMGMIKVPLTTTSYRNCVMLFENVLQQHKNKKELMQLVPHYAKFLAHHSKELLKDADLMKFLESSFLKRWLYKKQILPELLRQYIIKEYRWHLPVKLLKQVRKKGRWQKSFLSTDQQYLVDDTRYTTEIFNFNAMKLEQTINWPPETRCLLVSPDMSYYATIFDNNVVTITDMKDGSIKQLSSVPAKANRLLISRDSNYIAISSTAANTTTTVWDRSGNVQGSFNGYMMNMSHDGAYIVVRDSSLKVVKIMDAKTGGIVQTFIPTEYFRELFITPDAKYMIAQEVRDDIDVWQAHCDSVWRVYDIESGSNIRTLSSAYAIEISNDTRYTIVDDDCGHHIRDFSSGKDIQLLPCVDSYFSPQKDFLISVSYSTYEYYFYITTIDVLGIDPNISFTTIMNALSKHSLSW